MAGQAPQESFVQITGAPPEIHYAFKNDFLTHQFLPTFFGPEYVERYYLKIKGKNAFDDISDDRAVELKQNFQQKLDKMLNYKKQVEQLANQIRQNIQNDLPPELQKNEDLKQLFSAKINFGQELEIIFSSDVGDLFDLLNEYTNWQREGLWLRMDQGKLKATVSNEFSLQLVLRLLDDIAHSRIIKIPTYNSNAATQIADLVSQRDPNIRAIVIVVSDSSAFSFTAADLKMIADALQKNSNILNMGSFPRELGVIINTSGIQAPAYQQMFVEIGRIKKYIGEYRVLLPGAWASVVPTIAVEKLAHPYKGSESKLTPTIMQFAGMNPRVGLFYTEQGQRKGPQNFDTTRLSRFADSRFVRNLREEKKESDANKKEIEVDDVAPAQAAKKK